MSDELIGTTGEIVGGWTTEVRYNEELPLCPVALTMKDKDGKYKRLGDEEDDEILEMPLSVQEVQNLYFLVMNHVGRKGPLEQEEQESMPLMLRGSR